MAHLGAVFFFIGIVAFFADAAWWNNSTSLGLDCLVLWQPIAPVMQEARIGRSTEQAVPAGTHHNLDVTGEDVSGRGVGGPHLDDDDRAGHGYLNLSAWRDALNSWFTPSTGDEIKERWPDTFRLDCSELGKPLVGAVTMEQNWRSSLRPMVQNNNSCVLVACTQAIEGTHCVVYEKLHGQQFPNAWRAKKNWTERLLTKCNEDPNVNKGGTGFIVSAVLDKIMSVSLRGVETASGKGYQELMALNNYTEHSADDKKHPLDWKRAVEILEKGPCVGRLRCACPWWGCFDAIKNNNWVYRGTGRDRATREACQQRYPKEKGITSHAVVCFDYRLVRQDDKVTELHIRVLDNHASDGPERWVDLEELDTLYSFEVDCLCGCKLQPKLNGSIEGSVQEEEALNRDA